MRKGSAQENIIKNVFASNNRASKYMKNRKEKQKDQAL